MGDVILTGLAANDPVPGNYLEINFAQGDAGGSNAARPILLVGNRTSSGTAVVDTTIYGPDTAVQAATESQITTLFGAGSELHRMWRWAAKINPVTAIYLLAVTESAGVAASGTLTIATTATGSGTVRLEFCEEIIETSFATGDTATTIAAAIVANFNAKTHLPCTAANVAGVITFTAKIKGPRGNEIRFFAQIISQGSVATTVSPTVQTALTSGATADSVTSALATLAGKRYYWQAWAHGDSTNRPAVCTQIDSQAQPVTGKRQRAFFGFVGTVANANAAAVAVNTARAELVWSENNPLPAAELAAIQAAVVAYETVPQNPRTNFIGYGSTSETAVRWPVPAPRDDADHPLRSEIVSALNNGVTPIAVGAAKKTYIVNRITTRSLTSAVADYRIRPAHKVDICDFFGDDLLAKLVLQYNGYRIGDDPPDGKTIPGPNVLTPGMLRAAYNGLLDVYAARYLIQGVATTKSTLVVQRSSTVGGRMETRCKLNPIDNFEQSANALDQV